jgi:hypothetical protein
MEKFEQFAVECAKPAILIGFQWRHCMGIFPAEGQPY